MSADLPPAGDRRTGSLRAGLFGEILAMAFDTLRANKLRSALTILGVVIGVTSIVAMTSLVRGFGDSMLPVGAFAFSNGVEAAIAQGVVHDVASLRDFVATALAQALAGGYRPLVRGRRRSPRARAWCHPHHRRPARSSGGKRVISGGGRNRPA